MNIRPKIAPDLLPRLLEVAPGRVVRRLERNPREAEGWHWHEDETSGRWTVRTERDEVVTLTAVDRRVATPADISCTCLVAPRCFHVLAVLSLLEVNPGDSGSLKTDDSSADLDDDAGHKTVDPSTDRAANSAGETSADLSGFSCSDNDGHTTDSERAEPSSPHPPEAPTVSLSDAQSRAARQALEVSILFLNAGASATGAILETELLRAIHECRAQGLHRLAASGLRVARALRDLHDQKPEFRLADLVAASLELLWTAHILANSEGGEVAAEWIGRARRPYFPVGTLRVSGLFSEPVIAGNGYAGVTTYLVDPRGRILTLADIAPGAASRVRRAYDHPIDLGDGAPRPRQLGRIELALQSATASDDLRLGTGADTSAVSSGVSEWTSGNPATLWEISRDLQLDRIFATSALSHSTRPGGGDLLFVDGQVVGAGKGALLVSVPRPGIGPALLRCVAPSDHAELAYRENLRLLARAPGLPIRLIGRVQLERPRTLALLAVGPPPDSLQKGSSSSSPDSSQDRGLSPDSSQNSSPHSDALRPSNSTPSWSLPEQWRGRCNMGLDRLQTSHVQGLEPAPSSVSEEMATVQRDPFDVLRRRFSAVVMGGRSTFSAGSLTEIDREVARLNECLMPGAAEVLHRVARAALPHIDPETGTHRTDPPGFSRAWLAAGIYLRDATRALRRATWFQDRRV